MLGCWRGRGGGERCEWGDLTVPFCRVFTRGKSPKPGSGLGKVAVEPTQGAGSGC